VRAKSSASFACVSALCLIIAAVQACAQAAPPPPATSGASFQDSANELSVAVGKTVLVDCARPIKRIAIGLGDVAEASAVTRSEVMVNGKAPGETSLIIWDDQGGRQFFNVTVRSSVAAMETSLDSVRREIRNELPGQNLTVTAENGVVYLRGTVNDLNGSSRAVQIAGTAGKVVNLLNVVVPPSKAQILLKVKFASVDRNKAKSLGINLYNLGLGNVIGDISTGQFNPVTVSGSGTGSSSGATATIPSDMNLSAYFPGLKSGATIEALQTEGVAEVLAEPNVMAMDGKEASFLAGGEYPYPVSQGSASGSGGITIAFKEYGVRLNFIPTITPRGTIRLQVAPEVSSLDTADAVTISGFTVDAITVRKMNTEVELADGQTFVLGGLLNKSETESFYKIPFIGDVPILGKFFQSKSINKINAELIVTVTPEIVNPIAAGASVPELKFPVKFLPPNSNIPMHQPDAKTAENTLAPPPATIPVEKLIQSMKPEAPLIVDSASGTFGTGSSASTPSSSDAATPPQ